MGDLFEDLLASAGTTPAEVMMRRGGGPLPAILRMEGVEESTELERIRQLPRRAGVSDELIDLLSQALRVRSHDDLGNENRLRPGQAAALREAYESGGLFAPMPCGSGKTLVTLLLATLLGSERPVLIQPGGDMLDKTRREFVDYRKNWRVRLPRLVSYSQLGLLKYERLLFELAPDLLMSDEAHMSRNQSAGCTRRIRRYVQAMRPVYVPLSGTLITDSIMDYHHTMIDTLGQAAPMPVRPVDAERWSRALDRDVGTARRIGLGALESLPDGFHAWMRGTKGIVHVPGSGCDAALEIRRWSPKLKPQLQQLILDTDASGLRPDGELLNEWEAPTCLSQLALGFYYVWDPLPPEWWLGPRRNWWAYSKAVLEDELEGFDTEGQIVAALDNAGRASESGWCECRPPPYAREGLAALREWRAVRHKFEPNTVPIWLDRDVMTQAIQHIDAKGWLVWVKFRAAGDELQRQGLPYYGAGMNPEPRAGQSCVVSIAAHGTGKNLQAWNQSLLLTIPSKADPLEQLICRTHREGQQADTVGITFIEALDYHNSTLSRAKTQARATAKASGFPQKLVDATWV